MSDDMKRHIHFVGKYTGFVGIYGIHMSNKQLSLPSMGN